MKDLINIQNLVFYYFRLFQIICKNCKDIEKIIIEKFKNIFKIRKDIGNEYFEGDYQNMIDIIYTTVKKN